MTGRSGEDGGPLETGAKTCRMFAAASPLLPTGLAVLRCPGLPRAETLRPSVLVGCAATGVRFGRFRWDDRAAAISVTKLLLSDGFADVTLCDRAGIIYEGRKEGALRLHRRKASGDQ